MEENTLPLEDFSSMFRSQKQKPRSQLFNKSLQDTNQGRPILHSEYYSAQVKPQSKCITSNLLHFLSLSSESSRARRAYGSWLLHKLLLTLVPLQFAKSKYKTICLFFMKRIQNYMNDGQVNYSTWLYFARRSDLQGAPVLICPCKFCKQLLTGSNRKLSLSITIVIQFTYSWQTHGQISNESVFSLSTAMQ